MTKCWGLKSSVRISVTFVPSRISIGRAVGEESIIGEGRQQGWLVMMMMITALTTVIREASC